MSWRSQRVVVRVGRADLITRRSGHAAQGEENPGNNHRVALRQGHDQCLIKALLARPRSLRARPVRPGPPGRERPWGTEEPWQWTGPPPEGGRLGPVTAGLGRAAQAKQALASGCGMAKLSMKIDKPRQTTASSGQHVPAPVVQDAERSRTRAPVIAARPPVHAGQAEGGVLQAGGDLRGRQRVEPGRRQRRNRRRAPPVLSVTSYKPVSPGIVTRLRRFSSCQLAVSSGYDSNAGSLRRTLGDSVALGQPVHVRRHDHV